MEYIEKLAREHVVCKTDSPNTRQYYGELRHLLPQKKHRILLLRYTDEKNLLCENAAYENFKRGLSLDIRQLFECYKLPGDVRRLVIENASSASPSMRISPSADTVTVYVRGFGK